MSQRKITVRAPRARCAPASSPIPHGAVVPPIHLSATYAFRGLRRKRAIRLLALGQSDPRSARRGARRSRGRRRRGGHLHRAWRRSRCPATCPRGARVLAPHDCYGGTYRLFDALARRRAARWISSISATPARLQRGARGPAAAALDRDPEQSAAADRRHPGVADAARAAGALVVVDNTFLSPAWQQPLALGADLVVHSTTKYINGHSDVVGGAVIAATRRAARAAGLVGELPRRDRRAVRQLPDAARPAHPARAHARACARTPRRVVESADQHPAGRKCYYPGLADHPGHDIARRQQTGFGAMVSFELAGGEPAVEGIRRRPANASRWPNPSAASRA